MKMPTDSTVHLLMAVFAVLFLPRWATAEGLLMVYADKPPYSFLDKGIEKGFLLERTRRVLSRSGVEPVASTSLENATLSSFAILSSRRPTSMSVTAHPYFSVTPRSLHQSAGLSSIS